MLCCMTAFWWFHCEHKSLWVSFSVCLYGFSRIILCYYIHLTAYFYCYKVAISDLAAILRNAPFVLVVWKNIDDLEWFGTYFFFKHIFFCNLTTEGIEMPWFGAFAFQIDKLGFGNGGSLNTRIPIFYLNWSRSYYCFLCFIVSFYCWNVNFVQLFLARKTLLHFFGLWEKNSEAQIHWFVFFLKWFSKFLLPFSTF
jgi:hypothetical protein